MNELISSEREQFRRAGFFRLDGIFADQVELCRQAVEDHASGTDALAVFRFGRGRRLVHFKVPQLAERDRRFRELAQSPALVSVVEDLIGPAMIFRDVVIAKPARAGTVVHYHQDAAYWDVARPQDVLSAWVALDDAPREAGCLEVLPGSHDVVFNHGLAIGRQRLPRIVAEALRRAVSLTGTGDNPRTPFEKSLSAAKKMVLGSATRLFPALSDLNDWHIDARDVPVERLVPLPARAGDVILFSSRLVHGSGPNTSGSPRRAYIVTYVARDAAGEMSDHLLAARA